MTTLKVENLSITYPSKHIGLDHVSFTIPQKEFFVICGPSGCGKTTLLQTIAGLQKCDEGCILIDGCKIRKPNDVAMVFQEAALFDHLSVFDNIACGLSLQGFQQNQIQEMVRETADLLSIQDLLNRKASSLSGGQQQRVAIARAMVRKPKVFLMDEPLSSLDVNLKRQLRNEISKLYQKSDAIFIYVTHDQGEAMSLGETIMLMKDGKIEQIDAPRNLYEHPSTLFSATFFGEGRMNVLQGFVKDKALYLGEDKYPCELEDCDFLNVTIRPESIQVGNQATGPRLQGVVEAIEWAKDDIYYHVLCQSQIFIIKSDQMFQKGDEVTFSFDDKQFLYFDQEGKAYKKVL
ncbi:MAG: ABC transporter ATP-binding protein [Erysipelotrichaceae bacterium]